ncbi:MAG: hypothetical protein ACREKE_06735, partial [bacterium]
MAALTGRRRGELCALRRSDWDPQTRGLLFWKAVGQADADSEDYWKLKGTKTGQESHVALDAKGAEVLALRRQA